MDLNPLLHWKAERILKAPPGSRRESDGQVQEGLSATGGPTCEECATRAVGGPVYRTGGGFVRSGQLRGHGGLRAIEGRAAATVSAAGAWYPEPRHLQPGVPPAQTGGLRTCFSALHGGLCQGQRYQAHRRGGGRWQGPAWSHERGAQTTPLHLVNVFAVDARMALAQQKAAGRNETAGALEVLDLLSLEGCIVTADALHCTRAFAAAVRERGGDYVLAIKANRGRLLTAVTQQFARSGKRSTAEQIDPATHDRYETRRATIMRNTSLAGRYGFPGVAAVGRITSRRRLRGQRVDAPFVRYYLLSKYVSPKRLLQITRSHWGIENQLHWVLDVNFAEDRNRSRCDNAPENLAIVRRLALNILRTLPNQASLRRKIKRAGWDNAFLMAALSHMR